MTVPARLLLLLLLGGLFFYISSNILVYEEAGMDAIMWVQSLRSRELDIFMRIGTAFGFEFFFVLVPLLAWWGDTKYQKLGASLFTLLLVVLFCVSILKATFTRPRPFVMNSLIADPPSADKIEFSYPSGHAWASMSFFFLAKSMQGLFYWVGAVIVSLFTLFTRVYFGVHYPHDLAAGAACGIALIILFSFAEGFLDNLFSEISVQTEKSSKKKTFLSSYNLLNATNAVALVLLSLSALANYVLSEEIKAKQQGILFVPFCLLGVILCRPFIPPMRCESMKYRFIRLLVGVPIIFSLYFLYRLGPAMRPVLATFVGGWVFCVAPHVFIKLNLYKPPKAESNKPTSPMTTPLSRPISFEVKQD